MLASDRETYAAIEALIAVAKSRRQPIVFWIGAGASAWAGYPLWQDLAAQMHSRFSREVVQYDRSAAAIELNENRFPDIFQRMRISDQPMYFNMLAQAFIPLPQKAILREWYAHYNRLSHCIF